MAYLSSVKSARIASIIGVCADDNESTGANARTEWYWPVPGGADEPMTAALAMMRIH